MKQSSVEYDLLDCCGYAVSQGGMAEDGKGLFHLQLTGGEPTLFPLLIEQAAQTLRGLHLRELELLKLPPAKKGEKRFFCHVLRGQSMAVHPNGSLFPCGQTLGDKHFTAGNLLWQQPDPETFDARQPLAKGV